MKMDIKFEELSTTMDVGFGEFHEVMMPSDYPIYAGKHEVTPKAEEKQVLETKEKVVMEDITVNAVPCYVTSNTSGGNTVYIGTEVNE